MRFVVLADTHFVVPEKAVGGNIWWNRNLNVRLKLSEELAAKIEKLLPRLRFYRSTSGARAAAAKADPQRLCFDDYP